MTVNVAGILRDSGGNPSPNRNIKFYTEVGYAGTLPSATLDEVTDSTGAYDFNLAIGVHILSIQYDHVLTKVNKVTVTTETPEQIDLDTLLSLSVPLSPAEIDRVQELVNQAVTSANKAENSAQSAGNDADKVAQDKNSVEQTALQVVNDKESVEQTAEEIETAHALIGTSIDGVYANTAAIVSIENAMLKLHPIS